jgi:RluA family pseudouridine synthase
VDAIFSWMTATIKLSSPETRQFWELPVLYEDEHLLALNKPAGLLSSPEAGELDSVNLVKLLHAGIEQGKPWACERGLGYLMNAYRLDLETSGVLLFARSKPVLVNLANLFGGGTPTREYVVLVRGQPEEPQFGIDAPLAPHPFKTGMMRVDPRRGKKSRTLFQTRERFRGYSLVNCQPMPDRPHQARVHLRRARLPVVGDRMYGSGPLLLSSLKSDYRLKPQREERPLIADAAVHVEAVTLPHPVSGQPLKITAEWPKDLTVAVRYLRRYAPAAETQFRDPTPFSLPAS